MPILQLGLDSKTLSEQELFDLGQNFIRTQLATVQGASVPLPYGGKFRKIMVDLDPDALYAKQLSATDISNALNLQNLILPAGTAKIGDREYQVKLNSSPRILDELNDLPIKVVNGATVYMHDVAQVRDGYAVQTNIVRTNGTRGALLTVLRNGNAPRWPSSTASRQRCRKILAGLPPELKVRAAVRSVAVRARRHQRRGARSRHRRLSHRPDDPAVPGKLAQHADRLHFDPAFDSDLAHRAEPDWARPST